MNGAAPRVTLYSRPGCGLCDEARALLLRLGYDETSVDIEFEEIDISSDPTLERRYLIEIPVVAVDGVEIARAPLSEATLRALLPVRRRR